MKKLNALFAFCLISICLCAQTIDLPFTSSRWIKTNAKTHVETFQGKECILISQGAIYTKDVDLRDGIIEFDISVQQGRGFPGIGFRVTDMDNLEHFYVRPHQSGNPDATQYTPIFNGMAGWQLYHGEGYSKAIAFKFNQWQHIKIDMHGITAEIYIDDMKNPLIKVTELKRGWQGGNIALISGNIPTHYANLQYTMKPAVHPTAIAIPVNGAGGLITKYQVSNQVDSKLFQQPFQLTPDIKSKLTWTAQSTESSGTINLSKFTQAGESTHTMIARVNIESDKDQVKALSFGFSDYIIVYLNDKALFLGKDPFMSRDYRFLGTIGFFDMVFLPLKKGANELWFVVSEEFGGWGVKAKFEDMSGIALQ